MERLGRVLERLGLMWERPVGVLVRLGAYGACMERVFKRLRYVCELKLCYHGGGSQLQRALGEPNYQDGGNLTNETLHRKTTYRE